MSPATGNAAAVGVGTLARSCNSNGPVTVTAQQHPGKEGDHNDNPNGNKTVNFGASASALAAARAAAAAEKGRWSDLETWLDCSLSALEACTRCVNWTSSVGYVGGLAYVRLLSLVLRLLCPLTAPAKDGHSEDAADDTDRLFFACCSGAVVVGKTLDGGRTPGGEQGRLSWARQRLAHVVDDLMWRLREGLPGRDIRLRLLQVGGNTCGFSVCT